jgi:hypothetical protein
MKDKTYKINLLNHCLSVQESALANARNTMDEAQEEANAYGAPKDRYDGFRNQQMRRRDLYVKQLEQAMLNIDLLKRVDLEKKHNMVDFGSLVITDSTTFFVVVGMGLVSFQNQDVAVISMLVPIYHNMKGKRVGEFFEFNDKKYKILEII